MSSTLYLLTTRGLGDFYVAAEDSAKAEMKLSSALNHADYGFSKDRVVINFKVLGTEVTDSFNDKPDFFMNNNYLP